MHFSCKRFQSAVEIGNFFSVPGITSLIGKILLLLSNWFVSQFRRTNLFYFLFFPWLLIRFQIFRKKESFYGKTGSTEDEMMKKVRYQSFSKRYESIHKLSSIYLFTLVQWRLQKAPNLQDINTKANITKTITGH